MHPILLPMSQPTDVLASFAELLDSWLQQLEPNLGDGDAQGSLRTVQAASVEHPLEELTKLAQLIRAHTTKVGIIFKPETLHKEPSAAYKTVQQLTELAVMMMAVVRQLDRNEVSGILYDEVLDGVKQLLRGLQKLVAELQHILLSAGDSATSLPATGDRTGDARLISVGLVWNLCDSLAATVKQGNLGVLGARLKRSIGFIDDGLDEFAEWAEDPYECDFGDEGAFDDAGESESIADTSKGDFSELKAFSLLWLQKIKLVKLLLTSITRSLPEVSGSVVDDLYSTQKRVAGTIDKLISVLMMNMETDSESAQHAAAITQGCNQLVRRVKEVNHGREGRTKWCDAWEAKFAGAV